MMSQIPLEIKDRSHHDRVNLNDFLNEYDHPGALMALKVISGHEEDLKNRSLLDFSTLEEEFLIKLQKHELQYFDNIKVLMVDEYHDTNLLQECIYFEMTKQL